MQYRGLLMRIGFEPQMYGYFIILMRLFTKMTREKRSWFQRHDVLFKKSLKVHRLLKFLHMECDDDVCLVFLLTVLVAAPLQAFEQYSKHDMI